jgi:hypothetical protein
MWHLCIPILFLQIDYNLQQLLIIKFVQTVFSTKLKIIAKDHLDGTGKSLTIHSLN